MQTEKTQNRFQNDVVRFTTRHVVMQLPGIKAKSGYGNRLLRCHFMLKMHHFTKTGSGQTQGKSTQKQKECRGFLLCPQVRQDNRERFRANKRPEDDEGF